MNNQQCSGMHILKGLRTLAWGMALALLMPFTPARADSPLTSTQLADAYQDLPIVQMARRRKVADGEVLAFLISDAPTDQKAAVINALGWDIKGQRNGYRFVAGLAAARGLTLQALRLQHLRPVDRFVLGYLLAMDDYFKLSPLSQTGQEALWQASPLQLVSQAAYALPEDFTVHFVRSIVQGQGAFSRSWCSIYLEPQRILAQFPVQQRNMRSQAVDRAMQYLKNYESYCQQPAFADAQQPTNPELNQIYKIAAFQDQMVTATQGGIVFWNPQSQTATATREERLCTSVMVWSESLWVGCRHRLWRFDGNQWKLYRYDPQSVEGGFQIHQGPQGQLLARHRGQLWQFDTNRDRFVTADTELGSGQGYDLIYRQNGEQWRIDFLKGLERNQQRLSLRSEIYPGSDPRAFYEAADGRLWVVDFKDGFFRYDDDAQRFQSVGEVTRHGSAIAVDRTHTYFLHYTSGLYIHRQGETQSEFINLSELRYMRDLLIDQKGDIWVAGWNQLIRLRKQGKNWLKDVYRLNS